MLVARRSAVCRPPRTIVNKSIQHIRARPSTITSNAGSLRSLSSISTFKGPNKVLLGSLGVLSSGLLVSRCIPSSFLYEGDCQIDRFSTKRWENDPNDADWSTMVRSSVHSTVDAGKRKWSDDGGKVIMSIIGLNTVVFGLWRHSFRNLRLHRWMWEHFACSYTNVVRHRRFHTLLTSAFSHITLTHFGINMFMLWEFGHHLIRPSSPSQSEWYGRSTFMQWGVDNWRRMREAKISAQNFLGLYLSSALVSSAVSAAVSNMRRNPTMNSIGASGAVMGVFTVYCLLYPERRLYLFGLVELTAMQALQLTTATNFIGGLFQQAMTVDFVGHLGGQGTGYLLLQNGALK